MSPPPPSRAKEPHPLLFLAGILSQQECNGLLIPVNVRILDQSFSLEPIWNPPPPPLLEILATPL